MSGHFGKYFPSSMSLFSMVYFGYSRNDVETVFGMLPMILYGFCCLWYTLNWFSFSYAFVSLCVCAIFYTLSFGIVLLPYEARTEFR